MKKYFAVLDGKRAFLQHHRIKRYQTKDICPDQLEKTSIRSIAKRPAALLKKKAKICILLWKSLMPQSWYLPVMDSNRHFKGFISKTNYKYRGNTFGTIGWDETEL